MISAVVAEELRKQLPGVVESVLTERYLRKVVAEATSRRHAAEAAAPTYEDDVPEPEENDNDGIYHEDSPMLRLRQPTNEARPALLDPTRNPFASLFEGVRPIPTGNDVQGTDVPIGNLKRLGVDFTRAREMAGVPDRVRAPQQVETRRVHRPEWDRVVDTRPDPSTPVARRPAPSPPVSVSPIFGESAAFPDRPVTFDE